MLFIAFSARIVRPRHPEYANALRGELDRIRDRVLDDAALRAGVSRDIEEEREGYPRDRQLDVSRAHRSAGPHMD